MPKNKTNVEIYAAYRTMLNKAQVVPVEGLPEGEPLQMWCAGTEAVASSATPEDEASPSINASTPSRDGAAAVASPPGANGSGLMVLQQPSDALVELETDENDLSLAAMLASPLLNAFETPFNGLGITPTKRGALEAQLEERSSAQKVAAVSIKMPLAPRSPDGA